MPVSFSLSLLLSTNYKMYQDKFTLKWKFFITNLSTNLSNGFRENRYSDVTLVSDDKIPFQAHKYVLSASSPLLKTILLDNPQSHPLIYLRGVKHQELESILQFIYLGEATFYHNNIDRFIQASKDLQIKQLAETVVTGNTFTNQEEPADYHDMDSRKDDIFNQDIHVNSEEDAEYENDGRSISSIADEIINLDIPGFYPGRDELGSGKQLYKCEECEATYKRSKHEGIVYSCQQCSYKATQQSNLKRHQESVNEGVKYSCNKCEYQTPRQGSLKTRQQSVHEGVTYFCNQYGYQATAQSNIKMHRDYVHEGVKYLCNQCEYQNGDRKNLRRHQRSIHKEVKYCCNQCEYQAGRKTQLKRHKRTKHSQT